MANSALLVIDVQRDVLAVADDGPGYLPRLRRRSTEPGLPAPRDLRGDGATARRSGSQPSQRGDDEHRAAPGSVEAPVGMNQPLAQGCDDRHAATRISVRKPFRLREIEEPKILRGHDRLLHHPAMLVDRSVGAPAVILHRHRAVGMQRDHTPSAAPAHCLVSGVSNDLENKVFGSARRELLRIPGGSDRYGPRPRCRPSRAWCLPKKPLIHPFGKHPSCSR